MDAVGSLWQRLLVTQNFEMSFKALESEYLLGYWLVYGLWTSWDVMSELCRIYRPLRLTFRLSSMKISARQGSVFTSLALRHLFCKVTLNLQQTSQVFRLTLMLQSAWVFSYFKFSRIWEFGLKNPKNYPSLSLSNPANICQMVLSALSTFPREKQFLVTWELQRSKVIS